LTTAERKEFTRLRRENRVLGEAREILAKAGPGVCHAHERELMMMYRRWELASRSRSAGAGFKAPGADAFKKRGDKRPRKSHPQGWQVCVEQMSENKPADDASLWLQGTVKTGVYQVLREQSGRNLLTDPAAVGVKAA